MDQFDGITSFRNYTWMWSGLIIVFIIIGTGSSLANPERRRASSDQNGDVFAERDLQLDAEMKSTRKQSSEDLVFKCKVSYSREKNVTFSWYHDNIKIDESDDDRISIKQTDYGSRLHIAGVYTPDEGQYRCEASDGEKSVHTEANLRVMFNTPPAEKDKAKSKNDFNEFRGRCEVYAGHACSPYITGKIYVESFQNQAETEQSIAGVLKIIDNESLVPKNCAKYARPAFCHFFYPLCDDTTSAGGEPLATKLCRGDCELLQYHVCADVSTLNPMLQSTLKNSSNCDGLPQTSTGVKCLGVGLDSIVDTIDHCYSDNGASYKGVVANAESGDICLTWPRDMVKTFPSLAGGHNFCRNPGGTMDKPWCFIDENKRNKVACSVQICATPTGLSDVAIIVIPCVCGILLIGCIVVGMWINCRRGKGAKHTPGRKLEMNSVNYKKVLLPELSPELIHFSVELGEGKYGKVFKAQIMTNSIYSPSEPVAVKTMIAGVVPARIKEFQTEIDMCAELQHINVSCLKAYVMQPTLRCMIFEYTTRVDLHELLTLHSPHSDISGGKLSGSVSSHTSSTLEESDFLHMAVQVASGLEYLATQSFIHRDLAARNILVCSNNILKISNLGVVRDCYLSSYYRSPQGGHMLPVRWMAPESLTSHLYSEKSVIWSFGVLIWEMFSYGQQPYCGYSNHEVIDMIAKGMLLNCPDHCSSRVYSVLRECWSSDPNRRPTSKELHAKLSGWEGESSTRMTSQLAQGIHRQLGMIRNNTQFQYSPPQTVVDGLEQQQYSPSTQLLYPSGVISQTRLSSASPSSSGAICHPPPYPSFQQQAQHYPPMHTYSQPPAPYPTSHSPAQINRSSQANSTRGSESGGSSTRNLVNSEYKIQGRNAISGQIFIKPNFLQHQYQQSQQEYLNNQENPDVEIHSLKAVGHSGLVRPGSRSPQLECQPGVDSETDGLQSIITPSTTSKPELLNFGRTPGSFATGVVGQTICNDHNLLSDQQGSEHSGAKSTFCDSGLPTEGETDSGGSPSVLTKLVKI